MSATPIEVRVAAWIVGAAAVVFIVVGVLRADALRFPLILALLSAVTAAGLLLTRWTFVRPTAAAVASLLAIAHTMIALGQLPWWARVVSGLLAAAHGYVVVLLLTRPARVHFGGKVAHEH